MNTRSSKPAQKQNQLKEGWSVEQEAREQRSSESTQVIEDLTPDAGEPPGWDFKSWDELAAYAGARN